MKKITETEANFCENVIEVSDRKGFYIEKPSLIDKFERRDKVINSALLELCYIQFAKRYSASHQEPKEEDLLSKIIQKCSNEVKDMKMIKDWDFIITYKFEVETQVMSLPKFIKIKNLKPGEPRYMRLRAARVVRLHKLSREKTPHEYYFSELQLYMPFEKEEELEPQSLEKCKGKYEQISEHNGM